MSNNLYLAYHEAAKDAAQHRIWAFYEAVNGNWTTNEIYTNQPGPGDVTEHKVDGTFSLVGHFTGGFFFSDSDESHETADVRHSTTYADPDWGAKILTGSNTPDMTVEDFRPK